MLEQRASRAWAARSFAKTTQHRVLRLIPKSIEEQVILDSAELPKSDLGQFKPSVSDMVVWMKARSHIGILRAMLPKMMQDKKMESPEKKAMIKERELAFEEFSAEDYVKGCFYHHMDASEHVFGGTHAELEKLGAVFSPNDAPGGLTRASINRSPDASPGTARSRSPEPHSAAPPSAGMNSRSAEDPSDITFFGSMLQAFLPVVKDVALVRIIFFCSVMGMPTEGIVLACCRKI